MKDNFVPTLVFVIMSFTGAGLYLGLSFEASRMFLSVCWAILAIGFLYWSGYLWRMALDHTRNMNDKGYKEREAERRQLRKMVKKRFWR